MKDADFYRATFLSIIAIGLFLCSGLDVAAHEAADGRGLSRMAPEMMQTKLSPMDAWLYELGFAYDPALGRVRNPFDFPCGEADPSIREGCFVSPLSEIFISQIEDLSRPVVTVAGKPGHGKSAFLSWLASQSSRQWMIYRDPRALLNFVEVVSNECRVIRQNVNPYYLVLDIDDGWSGDSKLLTSAVNFFMEPCPTLGNAVLRLFLPQKLADSFASHGLYILDWSSSSLCELLTLRLTWASEGKITDLSRLFDESIFQEPSNPHEELASIARYPRRMFEIGQHFFNLHFATLHSTHESVRLRLSTYKGVYAPFADDIGFTPKISQSDIALRLTRSAGSVFVNGRATSFPSIPAEAKDPSRINSETKVKNYGRELFGRVLEGEDRERYQEIFDSNLARLTAAFPINIHLHLPLEDELLSIPWELMHDDQRFLIPEGKVEIIRHLNHRQPAPNLIEIEPPLRVLYIAPRPTDQGIFPQYDKEALHEIAKVPTRVLEIHEVLPPTYEELKEWILPSSSNSRSHIQFHVIHYDGHGAFGFQCPYCETVNSTVTCSKCKKDLSTEEPQGFLFFEKRQGYSKPESDRVSAKDFANLLASSGIPVVFLSACSSAVSKSSYVYNGIAARLMLAGIPGVVGIQGDVSAPVMKDFVKGFYDELVRSGSSTLISALAKGRRWLSTARCKEAWWYLPVLYLRDEDHEGKVFQLKSGKKGKKA